MATDGIQQTIAIIYLYTKLCRRKCGKLARGCGKLRVAVASQGVIGEVSKGNGKSEMVCGKLA